MSLENKLKELSGKGVRDIPNAEAWQKFQDMARFAIRLCDVISRGEVECPPPSSVILVPGGAVVQWGFIGAIFNRDGTGTLKGPKGDTDGTHSEILAELDNHFKQ